VVLISKQSSNSEDEQRPQIAYRCLQRIDHDGAYANLLLQSELGRSKLSERDRGFVTELVYGTTRMRRACDALIDRS
jgi:16S rRNA (cytosine967-C5)-methyltransferase